MIKTNEWTIADLTKYLVSVKDSLTPEEMTRLKATAAFPIELKQENAPAEKRTRYKAGQLYEPLEVFRTLGLPIIDWGQHTKWRSSSEEGIISHLLGYTFQRPDEKSSQTFVQSWLAALSSITKGDWTVYRQWSECKSLLKFTRRPQILNVSIRFEQRRWSTWSTISIRNIRTMIQWTSKIRALFLHWKGLKLVWGIYKRYALDYNIDWNCTKYFVRSFRLHGLLSVS